MAEAQSYRDLGVHRLAHQLAVQAHQASKELPKSERWEEGAQLRRAAMSVPANIVEGFGRRRYKPEFVRFLVIAHASCQEVIEHLELLYETGCMRPERYEALHGQYDVLGRMLNRFIASVEAQHRT